MKRHQPALGASRQGVTTRVCSTCGVEKQLDQFSKAGRKRDGTQRYASSCKKCEAKRARDNYWRDPDRHRVLSAERRRSESGRLSNLQAVRRWQARNPEAVAAHAAVREAKRRGELELPNLCSTVGCTNRAEHFHHTDYSRPLAVKPLCRQCHEALHHYGDVAFAPVSHIRPARPAVQLELPFSAAA